MLGTETILGIKAFEASAASTQGVSRGDHRRGRLFPELRSSSKDARNSIHGYGTSALLQFSIRVHAVVSSFATNCADSIHTKSRKCQSTRDSPSYLPPRLPETPLLTSTCSSGTRARHKEPPARPAQAFFRFPRGITAHSAGRFCECLPTKSLKTQKKWVRPVQFRNRGSFP